MKIALLLLVLLGMQEAQANEAEFVKTKEGCSVMLEVITIVDSVSWSGKCVDGRIEGVGIATYVKGNKKISFIEEYMGGVRAYPYIVDKSGAIRLSGGTEARYVTMELCKKLDECSALYDYAVKSKRLASLDNRIGKDIEGFGRDTSLSVIGGGKVVYTQYPQGGYSFDFDYSGVQATAAPPEPSPKSAVAPGRSTKGEPSSHLSVISLCADNGVCGNTFVHYENGQDPQVIVPGYYARTNGSVYTVPNYVIKDCTVGWTANVGGINPTSGQKASAIICGAVSAERALTAGFEKCNENGSFNCKTAPIIDVQWAYWDGSYPADPNPEYEMKSKGSNSSIGGVGGGGCRLYDQNLISCEEYKSILRSVGVGH